MRTAAISAAFLILCSYLPAVAQAVDSVPAQLGAPPQTAGFAAWLEVLDIDPRVEGEIARFEHDDMSPSDGYGRMLALAIRDLVVRDATAKVGELAEGQCEPFVEADFPSAGFATDEPEDADERFESGFVRTEMVACFQVDSIRPAALLEIYTSPDFRMEVESRLERIWQEDGLSCVETGGMWALLDPTLACNRIDRFAEDGIAAEHSQVVWNQGEEPFQDIYFKESLKTFVRIPGGVALHYINYSRTIRLGRLKRALGRGKIEGSQRNNAQALADRIGASGSW